MKNKKKKIRLFSRGNEKGMVTVLVSLLLVPVILFSGLMVDFARVKMAESQAVFTADLYANSVLASYNKEMYDMYALFGFTPNEELEAELAKIASTAYGGSYEITPQGVEKLVGLIGNSYSPTEATFAPFGNSQVSYSYSVAESRDSKGTLANDDIFRTQITDYTVTRMPTFLIEGAIDGGDSEIEQIMETVDQIKNLDKYSKITSIKGQLDAELEVFFKFLKAYNDDLHSLKSASFSGGETSYQWVYYSNHFGEYGMEELSDVLGEYTYKPDGTPSTIGYELDEYSTSYLEIVGAAYNELYDYRAEIDACLTEIENLSVDATDNLDEIKEQREKLNDMLTELSNREQERYEISPGVWEEGFVHLTAKMLGRVGYNLNRIIYRITDSNAYTNQAGDNPFTLKSLEWARDMVQIGEKLDSKKEKINNLINDIYTEREKAINSGCDIEIIDQMIGDYYEIQKLTTDDFSYTTYAQKYTEFAELLRNSVVGGQYYSSTSVVQSNEGALGHDLALINSEAHNLTRYCQAARNYADEVIVQEDFILMEDYITQDNTPDEPDIKDTYAYVLDNYDLFNHTSSTNFTPAYLEKQLFGLNGTELQDFEFMHNDKTVVNVVYTAGSNSGTGTTTVADICDYIKRSFQTSNIGDEKENSVLKKAKKLLDDMDGVSLDVYEDNPVVIGDAVVEKLATKQAAEEKKSKSMSEMLTGIDSFFPTLDDQNDNFMGMLANMIVMLYDYNMFSCDTTDKVPNADLASKDNKLSSDKQEVHGGNKLELGDGKDESSALANLAQKDNSDSSSSSSDSSSSKDKKKNIFYTEKEDDERDESMTDQCYADTSLLYRCELEYLYSGNKEMQKNLNNTRLTIIAERTVFNYMSTYTTDELNNVLNGIRNTVSAVFTPAVGIITDGVLRLAIAALETNSDMTMLLSGDSVVLLKTDLTDFSSYTMIANLLNDSIADAESAADTSQKGKITPLDTNKKKSTIPKLSLNYKQYLLLNILIFTNKDDLLQRTRDLIDLNVNKKQGNVEIKDDVVVLSGDDYFRINDQITVINADCSVQMSPLFASLGVDKLTDDSQQVMDYLTDKRTYSVTKGY
ncbi:MAG: hypothetical protein J6K17_13340 [Oscillospiraceae bacterium]|nr:hypothetical protein [Oscillospiraceae bacterium]